MKKAVYITAAVILVLPILGLSQQPKSQNTLGFGLDFGITTFFGDVDDAPAQSDYTNNFAFRASVNKNIWYWLALEGHVLAGNLSGEKKRTSGGTTSYIYFTSKFVEYIVSAEINAVPLFTKKVSPRFDVIPRGGIGLINFKTNLYNGTDDVLIDSYGYVSEESSPEFAMLLGVKLTYKINKHFYVVGLTSNRIVNSDYVDSKSGMDEWDFFNYTAVGLSYKIFLNSTNSSQKSFKGFGLFPKKKKNSKKSCPVFK